MSILIFAFLQLAYVCQIAQAGVTPYPRVPGDQPNLHFPSVRVNDIPIDTVSTDMKVGYAHLAFSGTVTVEVIASSGFQLRNYPRSFST